MLHEDELVDEHEAEREPVQQREQALVEDRSDKALPEATTETARDARAERCSALMSAIQTVLEGRFSLQLDQLQLPARELRALEAVRIARTGRNRLGKFVFASDRRDLLEQALASLQPDLLQAHDTRATELHGQLEDLVGQVGELRHQLTSLEDSQDELLSDQEKATLAEVADPSDPSKPKPKPTPSDPDAPRPATTLTGPDRPEPAPPPTTLTGPELREPPPPPTTLTGPDLEDEARPPSTLGAPEPDPAPDKTKRSWWKRPFA